MNENLDNSEKTIVEMGVIKQVVLNKMFGPTIFADLRITIDLERGWVVERRFGNDGKWVEWCIIPAQIENEFNEG